MAKSTKQKRIELLELKCAELYKMLDDVINGNYIKQQQVITSFRFRQDAEKLILSGSPYKFYERELL